MDQETLQERSLAAKARLSAAREKRARLHKEHETIAQIEAEERAAKDEEAIAEAEEKHGVDSVRCVRTTKGVVIVKRPNAVLYKRFRDVGKANTIALERLVRGCLVHPDSAGFDQLLEEIPGTLDLVANEVVELAGFVAKEVSEK